MATRDAYAPMERLLGGPPLPMQDDHAPRIERQEVWIAEQDGQGTAVMVLERAADHFMIYSPAVSPGHQGQGIGRWLIQAAERMARTAGAPELRLYTNDRMTRNLAIYRQAGFRETGRRPHPRRTGWTLVDMAKPVPPLGEAGAPLP